MIERIIEFTLRRPLVTVLMFAAVFVGALPLAGSIETSYDLTQFYPDNDNSRQLYEEFIDKFGRDDDIVVVTLKTDDLFRADRVAALLKLTDEIGKLEGVEKATNVLTAEVFQGDASALYVKPIFDEMPASAAGFSALKERVLREPLLVGPLVNREGTVTAVLVELLADHANGPLGIAANDRIKQKVEELAGSSFEARVGGIPSVRADLLQLINRDTLQLMVLGFFALSIMMVLSFMNLQGLVLPMTVVTVTLFVTLAVMKLIGATLNILTSVLPLVVLVVGSSSAIHVISRYYEELALGLSKRDAVKATMKPLILACFLTSFTTAVGFATLMATNIQLVRDYGTVAALGTLVSYVVAMGLLPAMLMLWRVPKRYSAEAAAARRAEGKQHASGHHGTGSGLVEWIIGVNLRRTKTVLLVTAVATVGGLFAASQSRIDARLLDDLYPDHPLMLTNMVIENHLGGTVPLELVLTAKEAGYFREPANLKKLDQLATEMRATRGVGYTVCYADFVKALHYAFFDGREGERKVPETRELLSQLMLLLSGGEELLGDYIADDERTARVSSRFYDLGSSVGLELFDKLEKRAQEIFGADVKVTLTGTAVIASRVNLYLVYNLASSFIWAFLIITVVFIFLLRSPGLALLSLVPNLLPLLATFATIAAVGETLKPSTALTFSIAFGIAVDDTIHFLSRFVAEFQKDRNYERAVERALRGIGLAMIYTTVVLVAGFGVGFVSELKGNVTFAILGGVTLTVALLADLFLSPALLLTFRPPVPKLSGAAAAVSEEAHK